MKKFSMFAIFAIVAGMCLSCGENERENQKGTSSGRKANGCKSCGCLESNSINMKTIA
jgi:hypothetical protein